MKNKKLKEEIKNIKESIQLTKDQKVKCNLIIHSVSGLNGGIGGGLGQFPFADTIPMTAAQIGMVISLGKVFDMRVSEAIARSIVKGAIASIGGRELAKCACGWIKIAGNIVNATTAVLVTEIIGWIAVAQFSIIESSNKDKYKVEGIKEGFELASEEYAAKFEMMGKEAELFRENILHGNADNQVFNL